VPEKLTTMTMTMLTELDISGHTRGDRHPEQVMSDELVAAREAYAHHNWPRARELFSAAREHLTAEDLAAAGDAAWWLGHIDETLRLGQQAYHRYLADGQRRQAAMAAGEVGYTHFLRGDGVLGETWLGRASSLLATDAECVEHGYIRYFTEAEAGLDGAEMTAVLATVREIAALARRHNESGLIALTTLCQGRALIKQGDVAEGLALLDEAMAAVLTDRLRPDWAGNIYCHVIAACHELADLQRMRAWTAAMRRWCQRLPAAVLFTGICRVHRAQLMQVGGEWAPAEAEAERVCADLAGISVGTVAEAHYVVGDIRRMRGDLPGAEAAYLRAHELGRDPQPGMSLLRLAQGKPDVALASIKAALTAEAGPLSRARLCFAAVEIALADTAGDIASKAADELSDTAGAYPSPGLRARADHATGAVLLSEGHPDEALPRLRAACREWRELEAVRECADSRQVQPPGRRRAGDQ
jgi:tetratricopeptide (TPR) repeat protein